MDLDNDIESDDNELEWRYSTKKREVEPKRPKLKKSYTLFDNFHYNSTNDNFSSPKLFSESQKYISAHLKKNFLQSIFCFISLSYKLKILSYFEN